MRVLMNRMPIRDRGWGGGAQFFNAMWDHAASFGIELVDTFQKDPHVVFIMHPEPDEMDVGINDAIWYRRSNPDSRLVLRVNECDARKATEGVDELWREMSSHCDHTIFVSEWMSAYHRQRGWRCASHEVVKNGYDPTRFVRLSKLSEQNGKMNIVCAHWSDNPMKGERTYEHVDDFVSRNPSFTFTYIGRTKAKFKNSRVLGPMVPDELAKELSRYDVCVNGTLHDPGPNSVIESISAGLPTFVSSDGGGAVEFAGNDHAFRDSVQLEWLLLSKKYSPNMSRFDTWKEVVRKVCDTLKASRKGSR